MHNGEKYLEFIAYSPSMARTISVAAGLDKTPKTASVAQSIGLANLKKMRTEVLAAALTDEADALFDAVPPEVKVAKAKTSYLPDTVLIKLEDVVVKLLCRGHYVQRTELVIKLEAEAVEAVCKFICSHGVGFEEKAISQEEEV